MKCCEEVVCEDCYVLLEIDRRRRFIFKARRGGVQGSDKGVLYHDDIIGLKYGSRVKLSSGYEAEIHRPTLYDFLEIGFHRLSQVIYPKDQGLLVLLAGVKPGARIVEIGVGSGFTTAVLAQLVGEEGRIYAYEIREDMARVARRNLEKIGLLDRVVLKVKDARLGLEEENIDAVIVDVPDPWNVLDPAYKALKPSGTLTIFIPSLSQAPRLLSAIKNSGKFSEPRVFEIMAREYQASIDAFRPQTTMVGFTGLIVFTRKILL